jgi:hypothetical protein
MVSPFQVEANSQYHDPANLIPEERAFGTHRSGAWVGPRVYPPAGNRTLVDQSIASHDTDWAIPVASYF